MSEADKMLEELGYVLTKERFAGEIAVHRYQKGNKIITFKIKEKYFIVVDLAEYGINMQELKAINEKVKELRMDKKRKLENLKRKRQEKMSEYHLTGNVGLDTVKFIELEAELFVIESEMKELGWIE